MLGRYGRYRSWILALALGPSAAHAATYEVISAFPTPVGAGNLVQGGGGVLYGTTATGGAGGFGTVFRLAFTGAAWTEADLYTFTGGADGQTPTGLILGTDGALYGTTLGGASDDGTIFRLAPSAGTWTKTTLHTFDGTGGSKPSALILGADGAFYGITAEGGAPPAPGAGTLYKLASVGGTWTHSVVAGFADGNAVASPIALVQKGGVFYGLSTGGGKAGEGTLFQTTLAGSTATTTVVYSFDHAVPAGGLTPIGLTLGADGALYTTTANGGAADDGVVLKSTQAGSTWTTVAVHSFGLNTVTPVRPDGPLRQGSDGTFFVTATQTLPPAHPGAVVQLSATWSETIVHAFAGGADGTSAGVRLLRGADGSLYGADDVVYRIGFGAAARTNKTDVLWQNSTGSVLAWFVDGTKVTKTSSVYSPALPGWTASAVADFDGDGQSDVVMQYAGGQTLIWLLNGGQIKSGSWVYAQPLPGWYVRGAGDFNGDGRPDILLQDGAGRVVVWYMYGTTHTGGAVLFGQPLPGWTIRGTADFNGDKKTDILWQHASGAVVAWLMDKTTRLGDVNIYPSPLPGYTVRGVGDVNNDGKPDILLQESTGRIAVWYLQGATIKGGTYIYHNLLGTDFRIAAAR